MITANTIKNNLPLVISLVLFLISLTQKTYCVDNDCGELGSGIGCLIFGAFAVFGGGLYLSWLANPLLLGSWLIAKQNMTLKIILSGLAIFFCLWFLQFDEITKNEAGHKGIITGYTWGYWLWTSSTVVYFIGCIIMKLRNKTS